MGSIGLPELMVIGVIVLILFGSNKLAQLGKGLGEGIRNFKEAVKGDSEPKDDTTNQKNP